MPGAGNTSGQDRTQVAVTHLQTRGEQRQIHRQLSGMMINASQIVWRAMGALGTGTWSITEAQKRLYLRKGDQAEVRQAK